MKQLSGDVSVDRGYRDGVAGSSSSTTSGSTPLATHASNEDLGVWGVDDWELPGQGRSGARCGEWYPGGVCESCGGIDLTTHSCGRRTCPDCWGLWAQEAAVRSATRIQAFRYTQADDWHRQVAHAFVSPAEGTVRNEREFYEAKSEAAEIAKEKGFRGFAVIPHPYRVTDEGKRRYKNEDPEYGIWVWLRNEVEDMERYIYWSPHYHIIGLTSANMEPAKESDQMAYTFERSLERFDGIRDTESHEDVYGLFRYLLSHTGYPAGSSRQVTTWHGSLANSVFVEDATEEWQVQKPSEGVRSALEREIEEVAGATPEDDEDGDGAEVGGDERKQCPREECDGLVIGVFDVTAYLRQTEPPPDIRDSMEAARDWRLGRVEPPPGMKRPQTEEQAREAWEAVQ